MAKTTTVTTSYTSDIVVNGTAISADKIYANGTQVRRCIVNGTDVIHKFTRTVVTASSNLTFNIEVNFKVVKSVLPPEYKYYFYGPIRVAVLVTDNGSSGFTQVTVPTITLTFYCDLGEEGSYPNKYYQQSLNNQVFTIDQTTYLEFDYFLGKYISKEASAAHFILDMSTIDPDEVQATLSIGDDYNFENTSYNDTPSYNRGHIIQRTINKTLSESIVQEY